MTIKEIQEWCRANKVDAHGYVRGGEFFIKQGDGSPQPSGEVLHWELTINGQSCPSSTSDMERLVKGKIPLDDFVRIMTRRSGRAE
ncbi:MAG: hypothetical protein ACREQP_08850 [Candidatus Binatia bacterium]